MIDCDERPGHSLDRTVRGDRRPCGPARPGRPGPAQVADRGRADLPGGGAGAAVRAASITGCGCATGGSGTCSRTCRKQPGYHKRLKAAAPLLAAVTGHLARQSPGWHDPVRLIDATPVPCGSSRETVRRSELAGWAHYGYCARHSRWYRGLKLYLITTPDGMPVVWCLADPKIGEREAAAEPVRPDRPATAGHGRLHLAQLGQPRTRQAVADRLRPVNSQGITHLGG